MDKSLPKTKSNSSLDEKHDSLQNSVLKKFKFLGTLKNYILSKFRSTKYEFNAEPKEEVSIISYDQRSFDDIEKEFDLQALRAFNFDPSMLQALKKVLNARFNNKRFRNKQDVELLEVIEKTFTRQLDIFEAVLKMINTQKENKIEQAHVKFLPETEESVDDFVNKVVHNLIAELSKNSGSSYCSRELADKVMVKFEETLGDSAHIKSDDIACECQQPKASGGAVPRVPRN